MRTNARRTILRGCVAATLFGTGCADEPERNPFMGPGLGTMSTSAGANSETGTADSDDGDDDDGPGADTDDDTAGETEGGSDGEGFEAVAQGIEISDVEANQGVSVLIASGGQPVPLAEQAAPLLFGRTTLIRATWQLASGSPERIVEGRLTITSRDGESETFIDEQMVGPESSLNAETTSFRWDISPELFGSGASYEIQLFEAASGTPGLTPSSPFPPGGTAPLGVEDSPMRMKIVFVPVVTPEGGVMATPELRSRLEEELAAAYPLQGIDAVWRAPWTSPARLTEEQAAWDYLLAARAEDNPATTNVYYHMLLDPETCCDSSQGQFQWGGLGDLIGDDLVEFGTYADALSMFDPEYWDESMGVVIHELGHNHGRDHAPCGGPDGTDPAFPYPGATLGVHGYDIAKDTLIFPDVVDGATGEQPTDFMGYCFNQWWSDYSWRALFARTKLSSMQQAQAPVLDGLALRGYLRPGRPTAWRVVPAPAHATPTSDTATNAIRLLDTTGEDVAELPVWVRKLPDNDTVIVQANISSAPSFERLELKLGEQRMVGQRSDVTEFRLTAR